ncbi:MAG TPA: calcium-binding protein [Actinomycetota bacterium]
MPASTRWARPALAVLVTGLLVAAPALVRAQGRAPAAPACTITGTSSGETLDGTSGADVICGKGGDDVIHGKGGDDTIFGGLGNDLISGGGGDDTIHGNGGNDGLVGGKGDDSLYGDGGKDTISAKGGKDKAYGGPGDDPCVDTRDGSGGDILDGGLGTDTAQKDNRDIGSHVERKANCTTIPVP